MSVELRGIRQRGNSWLVELTDEHGRRRPKTVKTLEEAVALKQAEREGRPLAPPAPECTGWTIEKTFEVAFATSRKEGGFRGNREDALFNRSHKNQIERYFGPHFLIGALRRATEAESKALDEVLVKLDAGKADHALAIWKAKVAFQPKTLDGFRVALLLGKPLELRPNKGSAVNRTMRTFGKALKLAADKGGLAKLPKWPGAFEESKFKVRFFTPEEERAMLTWCDHYKEPFSRRWPRKFPGIQWFRDTLIVLIDTGMRFGELQWIVPSDVDFNVGIILVHGTDDKGTKNGEHRSVPMTMRVREIMKRHVEGGEMFPYDYEAVSWHFDQMKTAIGLAGDKRFTLHTARHTCASRLVQRGVELAKVKEWLGHKHIQTTLRYAHLRPKDLLDVVHVLEPQFDTTASSPEQLAKFLARLAPNLLQEALRMLQPHGVAA